MFARVRAHRVSSDTTVSLARCVREADISSAITPVSSAAATELPEAKSYCALGPQRHHVLGRGGERPARGGAARCRAAAMTPGMAVGKPLAAPDEAPTKVTPRLMPGCTSAESSGSAGPAMLRFTSGAPEASAAASACASVKVLQAAASSSGLSCQQASNTSICACGAMPTMPMWLLATAAMMPGHGGAVPLQCRRGGAVVSM